MQGAKRGIRNQSRQGKKEVAVWQRRYWEHMIRDDRDFARHFDYIHYNPVEHGHVRKPRDWRWSSFRRYLKLGYYPEDWGSKDICYADGHGFGE